MRISLSFLFLLSVVVAVYSATIAAKEEPKQQDAVVEAGLQKSADVDPKVVGEPQDSASVGARKVRQFGYYGGYPGYSGYGGYNGYGYGHEYEHHDHHHDHSDEDFGHGGFDFDFDH